MDVSKPQESSGLRSIEDGVRMGIDIVEIARMQQVITRCKGFRLRVFTEDERSYCEKTSQPATHYAMRFAAKQAVLKSLGKNTLSGIDLKDIEIQRTSKGRPVVKLRGKARKAADDLGVVSMPVSLSFTHSEAVGCVMAITEDSVSAARKRVDPMKELSLQFKQARIMLDDLPTTDRGEDFKQAEISAAAIRPAEENLDVDNEIQIEESSNQLGGLFGDME